MTQKMKKARHHYTYKLHNYCKRNVKEPTILSQYHITPKTYLKTPTHKHLPGNTAKVV